MFGLPAPALCYNHVMKIIKGRQGSGKTFLMFREIASLPEDTRIFIVVPDQYTYVMERELFERLGTDAVSCINTLNQLFVDTVRATGGNNETRYLLCPGYAASPDGATAKGYVYPTDPAKHLIVSVHAYRPYNLALNAAGTKEFSLDNEMDKREIVEFMDSLYANFTMNGIPVVIGEFGARDKDNLQARVDFAAFYVAAARARGITCCWWDNHAFSGSGERFGLLMRKDARFAYPEIVQAMIKYCE